jgi:hypothetical protein
MVIEDPVEYVFPSVNQIQSSEQAGLSFRHWFESIMRQDPDVISSAMLAMSRRRASRAASRVLIGSTRGDGPG